MMKIRKTMQALACAGLLVFAQSVSAAEPGCHDARLFEKLIGSFCWNCIFPIYVAGAKMGTGRSPVQAYREPVCMCPSAAGPRFGISTSMWEPARLIEFQRVPGCSSVLGGFRFPLNRINQGTHGDGEVDGGDLSFTHYHYYSFPILMMLDLFVGSCSSDNYLDLDIMFLSEVDPTWNNDELAFFTHPESASIANPGAIVACAADAVSSAAGFPIDSMFWCAGSWGVLYPLSGHNSGGNGIITDSSINKVKVLATLHRRGLAHKTMGRETICGGIIHPIIPKSQYKFSLFHPVPETKSAHVTGEPTMVWGAGRTIPAVGEDPVYTIWRWNDCCNHF